MMAEPQRYCAGPQGSSIFDNLGPGTYQVEAVSNRGCTNRSGDVIILEPTLLQIATTAIQNLPVTRLIIALVRLQ